MLKLGAEHLPAGFDGPMDRKVAAAPHMTLVRLRMQQIAKLLVEALLAPLAAAPDAPLALVNIAGGPALDSINALIVLARAHASLLRRPIAIHVFDAQPDGPAFGARALRALAAPGAPLGGIDVQFEHHAYDWNDTARSRASSQASPCVARSLRPPRRAACSSTAPTTRSSPTSPRSLIAAWLLSRAR